MIVTFNDFIKKYNLKNTATSNIKVYEVLKKTPTRLQRRHLFEKWGFFNKLWCNSVFILVEGLWVCYIKDCYFDSYGYGCVCPKKVSEFIIKPNG